VYKSAPFIGSGNWICLFRGIGFVYQLSNSKVKAIGSAKFYNQTFNSRVAVFDEPTKRGEGTSCEARRTSPYCLSEASLRANVPSCRLRAAG